MPKAIMLVQSKPSHPDREDEYNDWYSNTHIPEVCAVDGIVSARRYKANSATPIGPDVNPYVAVYELEADDLGGVIRDLASRAMDGRMKMSGAMEMDPPPSMVIYELID
jgi:hypothetical protein